MSWRSNASESCQEVLRILRSVSSDRPIDDDEGQDNTDKDLRNGYDRLEGDLHAWQQEHAELSGMDIERRWTPVRLLITCTCQAV